MLLPSAKHLEERLTVSQPLGKSVNLSVRQAVGQAIGRPSTQADRQAKTHLLAFFQSRTTSTNNAEPHLHSINRRSSGGTLASRPKRSWSESRLAIVGAALLTNYSLSLDPGSNPSKHKLPTTNPQPHPQNVTCTIRGIGASRLKSPWGIVLSSKIMILRGVRHPISCL